MKKSFIAAFLFSLFTSLLFISGCAALPQRPPVENPELTWQARRLELEPLTAWEIYGRLAMSTSEEGWQASLHWVRHQDRHNIDLTGPLGGGHLRLMQDRNGAQLRDANHKIYRDSSLGALLRRATGWYIPLEGLNYWVRGLPSPDAPRSQNLDAWGRLKTLNQLGWDIRFLKYVRYGAYELPSKVFITRRIAQGEKSFDRADSEDETLEVRLVIERWVLKN